MDKRSIMQAIIERVGLLETVDYSAWTIGLTHSPEERKQEHRANEKFTTHWIEWVADSLSEAQAIESYFINRKGMKGGTGGDLSAGETVYVYIF